ncbi:hypothetical protein B0H13DRAFT_2139527 [Mycena leptocephala]|nr:hypothetical protein B0H13DRAFT_2139527 [Mycena leptocephala]
MDENDDSVQLSKVHVIGPLGSNPLASSDAISSGDSGTGPSVQLGGGVSTIPSAAFSSATSCAVASADPATKPFSVPGFSTHWTLWMPRPSRCSEVSENFFTELPWQSGTLEMRCKENVSQSASRLSTRDWTPGVFVHAVPLSGMQSPEKRGSVQACGTRGGKTRDIGALFTAICEMERTEVSAIDARKNMMIKIKRRSCGIRRKKRLREENGETKMERHLYRTPRYKSGSYLYTQIGNIFGPSQPCMPAQNNGLPWRASWERCHIVFSLFQLSHDSVLSDESRPIN